MGYIYILTSPSGKSYVGQTTRDIEERFGEHQEPTSACSAIRNAIQYYGWDRFIADYYECPDGEHSIRTKSGWWNYWERYRPGDTISGREVVVVENLVTIPSKN